MTTVLGFDTGPTAFVSEVAAAKAYCRRGAGRLFGDADLAGAGRRQTALQPLD